jgi:aspartokinase
MKSNITVLKFGSSVLREEADLPRAVHEIYRRWRSGSQVLAVVSAIGQTTDQLLQRAESLTSEPHSRSVAALLATGEATSAALLGIALHRAGLPVKVLSAEQANLRTSGEPLDAGADGCRCREDP